MGILDAPTPEETFGAARGILQTAPSSVLSEAQAAVRRSRTPIGVEATKLTEEQDKERGRRKFYGFLAGAHKGGLGGALLGMSEGPRQYEDQAKYHNYLDQRLKDPSLSKSQRDALMARRHNEEKYSSTFGPFRQLLSSQRASYSRISLPVPGKPHLIEDWMQNRYDPDDRKLIPDSQRERWKEGAGGTKTAKQEEDARKENILIDEKRAILRNRSPSQIANDLREIASGRADSSIAKLYEKALSPKDGESKEEYAAFARPFSGARSVLQNRLTADPDSLDEKDVLQAPIEAFKRGGFLSSAGPVEDAADPGKDQSVGAEADEMEAELRALGYLNEPVQ